VVNEALRLHNFVPVLKIEELPEPTAKKQILTF
jgi:hypothetical protein